jgi:hypothetical protein
MPLSRHAVGAMISFEGLKRARKGIGQRLYRPEVARNGGQGPLGFSSEPKTTRTGVLSTASATIDSPPPRSPHFRRVQAAVCSYVGAEMGCIGGVRLAGA